MKKYTFINAMVLSAALSGNVWADLNDGLVAYYPFNANAEDESGNGNDGTVPDNKDIITSYALTRNKWEHYTIVKRKLNIELFVNATSVFFNFS